ncbi:ATP-dependent RNA helicase DHX33 [Octopus sinensis]|uniref:RNA helicase n=1 Tax=Octopus sinensis TaxID=2607531 RepID=A0A6P7TJ54_9MOLL|nr:ATP-dependent RNA helicase DHX33 [Octopus sinensis]XP_036367929.1 ATP-dependent RNA helicase DHX33 [Octopus sinensis]XP_036367930.1 ATP-dependent RNA helicase DHX33 [Octopus sinensis]
MNDQILTLKKERQELPAYKARNQIISHIQRLSTAIVIGETGSGKTTQVPQYLYEAGLHQNGVIAITQPRRVAAMSISQRVAAERQCNVGELVGYSVRFDDMTSGCTKIKYMTDGMLLREAILDPLLKRYSIVILDEAHERTIHTDILFGVVKAAQKKRNALNRKDVSLKIIIMSATMDVDHFSSYFSSCPVLYLEGRQFPVKLYYTSEHQSDYSFSALVTVFQIHREVPPDEDILVFLTGQEEIESIVKQIRDISKDLIGEAPPMCVYPLYAAQAPIAQLRVFTPAPKGTRKVIVATNVAETSLTIKGIKHVIDSGMVKAKLFNPSIGLDLLKVVRVSKAQAIQRTGRAGRESPGTCYRLYTEQEFESFQPNTLPEIQRCNLSGVVLQMLAMGISDVVNFDFMDKPTTQSIINALDQLNFLGAVEKKEKIQLTSIGKQMAAYPLDPRLAKVILVAKDFNCLDEILSIVSLLSVDSLVFNPQRQHEEALAARKKFESPEGDFMTYLNILRAYKAGNSNKKWCRENFVNSKNAQMALDVRKQLRTICIDQSFQINSSVRDSSAAVRKCLVAGFFMNAAELEKDGSYITLSTRKVCAIHPSSSLFNCKPSYVIYRELVQTTKCYMRDVCVVDPDWLYDAAPNYFKKK